MQKQLGVKILTIIVVGVIILIPISMVKQKVYERQMFQEQAKSAVAHSWTGPQTMLTPVLVFPYRLSNVTKPKLYTEQVAPVLDNMSVLLPDTLKGVVDVSNKSIFKGIYEIPVYNAAINFSGQFSSEKISQHIDKIRRLKNIDSLGEPYLSVHISDVRGINGIPSLSVNNTHVHLNSGSGLVALTGGLHASLANQIEAKKSLSFVLDLSLRGMGSLSFVQLADAASTIMNSDWPHPEFTGSSLPVEREVSSDGFNANWSATRYSSNSMEILKQCIKADNCSELLYSSSGVKFIEPVDIYLQSERSVKYAMLFIGLSFITFFIFENIKKIPIHPIQYAFVGLAISVFYLLLISLAEHIAFYWAYIVAVMCCTLLLLFYVRYMLHSFLSASLFSLMILALYGLLYVIIQAEDFALLMGAFLVFFVLTVLMYVTRKIDWYNLVSVGDEASKA